MKRRASLSAVADTLQTTNVKDDCKPISAKTEYITAGRGDRERSLSGSRQAR